jgi:hypothetical protein
VAEVADGTGEALLAGEAGSADEPIGVVAEAAAETIVAEEASLEDAME